MPKDYYKLHQIQFEIFIDSALKEDIGSGDHTSLSCIDQESKSTAVLMTKQEGILAGLDLAAQIFARYDPSLKFKPFALDGSKIEVGSYVFSIS